MTEQSDESDESKAREANEADAERARRVDGLVWTLDRPEVRPSLPGRIQGRLSGRRWTAALGRDLRQRPRLPSERWHWRLRWWQWLGVWTAVAAVAALGLLRPARDWGWLPSALSPDTSAAAQPPVPGTFAHPFAGSPSRTWANGAHGITLSGAKPVGGVSKAAVTRAMHLTKKFLIAANLDRDVLNGGRPAKALALIDPLEKDYLVDLRNGLAHPSSDDAPTDVFTRFDTDEVRLVGDVVKVRGRMTVEPGKRPERAEIHADYTFVYPVSRVGDPAEVTRAVMRRVVDAEVTAVQGARVTPGKLWVVGSDAGFGNSGCVSPDGLLHPSFPSDRIGSPAPTGPTMDPYDRSAPLTSKDERAECGRTTRI